MGYFGSDGVFLFIGIEDNLRLVDIRGEDAGHIFAERFGDDDCGIVFSRSDTFNRGFLIREIPSHLVVSSQLFDCCAAGIQMADSFVISPSVLIHDGDREPSGIRIRVHACINIEPRI